MRLVRFERDNLMEEAEVLELARQVGASGYFTLAASGTRETPEWTVFAGGDPSSEDIAGRARRERERQELYRKTQAKIVALDDQAWVELLDQITSTSDSFPWGHPLAADSAWLAGRARPWRADPSPDVPTEPLPEWAPIPLLKVGQVGSLPLRLLDDARPQGTPDARTREVVLTRLPGQVVEAALGDDLVLEDAVAELIGRLEGLSSDVFTRILPGRSVLRYELGGPKDWFLGSPPHWVLDDPEQVTSAILLEQGSFAQRRWASLSIDFALEAVREDDFPLVVLVDEPEQGLHARAEAALPSALAKLARDRRAAIVLATHSADLLDSRETLPIHISRPRGYTVARPLPQHLDRFESAVVQQELGLTRSRLLQLTRTWVVVEGEHDELVLESLIGDELRAARARVVRMGGAKAAPSIVDAQLLWEFTDANVVLVLDGLASDEVLPIWERVRGLLASGRLSDAQHELYALERIPGGESKWLRELLSRAMQDGHESRLRPVTLGQPDIICYLPAHALVPGNTWAEILDGWRRHYARRQPRDLKGYIHEQLGQPKVTTARLRKALPDAVPHADLTAIAAAASGSAVIAND